MYFRHPEEGRLVPGGEGSARGLVPVFFANKCGYNVQSTFQVSARSALSEPTLVILWVHKPEHHSSCFWGERPTVYPEEKGRLVGAARPSNRHRVHLLCWVQFVRKLHGLRLYSCGSASCKSMHSGGRASLAMCRPCPQKNNKKQLKSTQEKEKGTDTAVCGTCHLADCISWKMR